MQEDKELIVEIPLEAQVFIAGFLYSRYQATALTRLQQFKTFPQWLQGLRRNPYSIKSENLEAPKKSPSRVFHFSSFSLIHPKNWVVGSALTEDKGFQLFDIAFGFFSLTWIGGKIDSDR